MLVGRKVLLDCVNLEWKPKRKTQQEGLVTELMDFLFTFFWLELLAGAQE